MIETGKGARREVEALYLNEPVAHYRAPVERTGG
jgi:hypothetical protein